MGLFGKKIEVKEIEINKGYEIFKKDMDHNMVICADELREYDQAHMIDAACFPLRLIDKQGKEELDPDLTYYVYAIRPGVAYNATKHLVKMGFNAYNMGAYYLYSGDEEGLAVKKKHRKRKK